MQEYNDRLLMGATLKEDDWPIIFGMLRVASGLSIIGSLWVITEILLDKRKQCMCYHRLLLAISSFNLLTEIWFFIGDYAQSPDKDRTDWNHGTVATCRMSGFSIYLGTLAIPWYNAALIGYYYLSVRCGWTEHQLRSNFERYVHLIVGPMSLLVAILPFCFDLYNVFYTYCFVVQYHDDRSYVMSDVLEMLVLLAILLSACSMAVGILLLVSFRYSRHIRIMQFERTSRGIQMATLYAASFFAAWVFPILYMGQAMIYVRTGLRIGTAPQDNNLLYALMVYLTICLPLQGFMNWLIYLYPRYQKVREELLSSENGGWCCCGVIILKEVLFWSCMYSKTIQNRDCYLGSCMVMENSAAAASSDGISISLGIHSSNPILGCETPSLGFDHHDQVLEDIEDDDEEEQSSSGNVELPPLSSVLLVADDANTSQQKHDDDDDDDDVKSELSVEPQERTLVDNFP